MTLPGAPKTERLELAPIRDRLTFLYVERCSISRQDSAITMTDTRGVAYVPAAIIGTLMLGPGTNISHRAMELLGDSGACVIWVGEHGVRYYAHGRSLAQSARLVTRQAELVSNRNLRLGVARHMYQMRFPGEDVSHLTMQQLRGREGARIRQVYRKCSKEYGVVWKQREYDPTDFADASPINQALSAAHACLYGLAHSVIVAMGLSPALGFVHTGLERSFVYDIADLYKAEMTIPIAFEVAATSPDEDISSVVRRRTRDAFARSHLLKTAVHDINSLLFDNSDEVAPEIDADVLMLWDDRDGTVAAGVSYRDSNIVNEDEPTNDSFLPNEVDGNHLG